MTDSRTRGGWLDDPEGLLSRSVRLRLFALTWLAYATYYLGRKSFSVVKARLSTELGLSTTQLGDIDGAYLASYAAGQFLCGMAGDRLGARRLIALGLFGSACACLAFGAGSTATGFALAFALNGVCQAAGWPGTVKAMAGGFRSSERGAVMGVWTTNYQVGGLAATALATWVLALAGWRATFRWPALALAAVGVVMLVFLPNVTAEISRTSAPAVGSRDVLRSLAVWRIGAAYFCLKLIRYSILFWLPFFLRTQLHYSESAAGLLSLSFELGGIGGAIVVGRLSDRVFRGRRREVSAAFIVGLAGALALYSHVAALGTVANFAGMALVGFCLFGPDALISGAAAQDLGGEEAAATAAGAINGMGSIGAVLQGRITSSVSTAYGWDALYRLFVVLALLAAAALALGRRRDSQTAADSSIRR